MATVKEAISQSFVKVYNFIQREFAYQGQIDLSGKFIPFGPDNSFPQHLSNLVNGSPTATSCLSTTADFIAGEGFNVGAEVETLKINSQGQSFQQFHIVQSSSLAHYWGVATLVKYNKVGDITQMFDVPFGYCRLGQPDDNGIISKIHYNPYFGTPLYRKDHTEVYDTFNPMQAVQQAADPKWKGQIHWMGIRDNKDPFYPVPDHYSAHQWMRIEKNAATYFDENLENGFLQPTILKIFGDPNDASGMKTADGEDIPKGKAFDKEMTENFAGAKRVGQIMTFWSSNKEEFPTVEAFPTNASAEMHRVTDDHAIKKITIATKVPSILANISEGVSLGGDGNTIRAAVKLMQQRVKRPQQVLLDYYQAMLKHFVGYRQTDPLMIVPYNPFPEMESVDPQVWEVLTTDEKREWVKDHTEIELIEEVPAVESPDQPAPMPVENRRVTNLHFNSYPSKAKDNVKRAIEWQQKFGATCLKPKGLELSQAIMKGDPLGPQEIKRLSRFLSKKTIFKNNPYADSCDALEYDAWGGSEMMVWANDKVKELNGKTD
jgi:hypothetical protein